MQVTLIVAKKKKIAMKRERKQRITLASLSISRVGHMT